MMLQVRACEHRWLGTGIERNTERRGRGGVHDALEVANLLEDALASREELVNKARERQHSEARVLDLRKLVLLKLALVLALR